MKKFLLLTASVFIFGCKTQQTTMTTSGEKTALSKTSEGDLIGQGNVKDLFQAAFRDWFTSGYESYKPDAATIHKLRDLTGGISVKIFMGTWCGDSKDQVPKFYKILHEAGFDKEDITLIFMDRNKTTPEKLESGLAITNVPTFIFYRTTIPGGKKGPKGDPKTKELNRIVESPRETLEADMLKILTNQAYKHTYAN